MHKIDSLKITATTEREKEALRKINASTKPDYTPLFGPIQVTNAVNVLKKSINSSTKRLIPILSNQLLTLKKDHTPDWEDIVQDYKIPWFKFIKKYIKEKAKLKTNIQKAAFAQVACDKHFLIGDDTYNKKRVKLIKDFCLSYFDTDVSTSLVATPQKKKAMEDNKPIAMHLFSIALPEYPF